MVDYPYASNFVAPLPAWPVDYSCDQAYYATYMHRAEKDAALYGIAAAANVYFNYDNSSECLDITAS